MANDDHISEHDFLLEFFGDLGREFGDPDQYYVDNPMEIFPFIEKCLQEKKPAFMSIEPRSGHNKLIGFESIFFDFDYGIKSEILKEEEITQRKTELLQEVLSFIQYVTDIKRYQPMIVKTFKGFHVSIYFDKVYMCPSFLSWSKTTQPYWKEVYRILQKDILNGYKNWAKKGLVYVDESCLGRIEGLKRIPFSFHQKNGEKCLIVTRSLQPDKIRAMAFYKNLGLKQTDLTQAMQRAEEFFKEKEERKRIMFAAHKEQREKEHGFIGRIRPCFQRAIESGEMSHQQRLAFLLEAWYSGIKTELGLVESFKKLHDYKEDVTSYQVHYFLEHETYINFPPYTCDKMREFRWCLESPECPRWKRIYGVESKKE